MSSISSSSGSGSSAFNIGGLISGLDTDDIIKQIMEAETHPLVEMEAEKSGYQNQLAAWKKLDGMMTGLLGGANLLSRTDGFVSRSATVSDEKVMSVSASSSAKDGSYNVRVMQLATTHQMKLQNVAGDLSSTFGTGTLSLTISGSTTEIAIDENNHSLSGIVDAINNSNANVTASYLQVEGGYQFLLTSKKLGEDGAITVNTTEGITGLSFTDLQTAQNAVLRIGSEASYIEVERSSNTITDIFPGVTMTLQAQSTDYMNIKVSSNSEGSRNSVNSFLNNYNSLIDYFDDQFYYDADSEEHGTLQGNYTLIQLQNKLDRIIFGSSSNSGSLHSLAQIGITADSTGKLSISDSSRFNKAVTENPDDLNRLFNDPENGVAVKIKEYINDLTGSSGIISIEEDHAQAQIDTMDDRMAEKSEYYSRVEERYREQFNALETALNTIKNQMSSISASISVLLGASSS